MSEYTTLGPPFRVPISPISGTRKLPNNSPRQQAQRQMVSPQVRLRLPLRCEINCSITYIYICMAHVYGQLYMALGGRASLA